MVEYNKVPRLNREGGSKQGKTSRNDEDLRFDRMNYGKRNGDNLISYYRILVNKENPGKFRKVCKHVYLHVSRKNGY